MAKGSAGEVRSQLYRAFDQGYITNEESKNLISRYERLSEQIAGFIKYLNNTGVEVRNLKTDHDVNNFKPQTSNLKLIWLRISINIYTSKWISRLE